MKTLGVDKIVELQKKPSNIRNICILAHVDHGKTTLADTLVASNGIISQRMAGKLRYLDSREDEQIRGITMKSSAISLIYNKDDKDILINLIDSPGHIDFSSEVSTAVRLCDGAIVLVDVVEGVCPQTYAVLRQAWLENIKPVLILNKIDRLITELKMSPLEAHMHLQQIIVQVNAITGELFTSEVLEKTFAKNEEENKDEDTKKFDNEQIYDWSSGLEETDDSNLYFSPDQGNVIFASAIDGWGFGVRHFAEMYAAKLGINANVLLKTLWGDFYLENKTKRIKKGAQQKGKKPMFVNFILENLWSVYEAVLENRDKDKVEKIVKSLNLKISARDSRQDPRVHLQAICSQWLPLSKAVLGMVVDKLPSPLDMEPERAEKLLCSRACRFDTLPEQTQRLKQDFLSCSAEEEAPVVVYVSKLFPVERKQLPKHKARPLTQQQMAERRELARKRHAEKMAAMTGETVESEEKKNEVKSDIQKIEDTTELIIAPKNTAESPDDHVFVAFARVFSGTVRKQQKLLVLGPKHDPQKALSGDEDADKFICEFVVEDLYLFMGRELESLDSVSAGNILGLGGLEEHILKSATISNTVACPAFTDMYFEAAPIVRVAVEPVNAGDIPKLETGLKLLNQADPCVEILIQENGEQVIIGAGEVHLKKCLDDLRDKYAKIEVNVSDPIVPFRESIIPIPKFDRLNEAIIDQNPTMFRSSKETEEDSDESDDEEVLERGLVEIQTPNRLCGLKIRALPLPSDVIKVLEDNADLIKVLNQYSSSKSDKNTQVLNVKTKEDLMKFKTILKDTFESCKDEAKILTSSIEDIWCFGPRKNGPNILLNKIPDYNRPSIWSCLNGSQNGSKPSLKEFDYCIASGFQMATLSGPVCEEQLHGVCFIIEDWLHYDKPMSMKERYKLRKENLAAQKLKEEESMKRVDSSGSLIGRKNRLQNEENISDSNEDLSKVSSAMAEVNLVSDSSSVDERLSTKNTSQDKTQDETSDTNQGECSLAPECASPESGPESGLATSPAWPQQGLSTSKDVYGPFSGQLMSCMKEGCRRAFQSQPQRLMWAMYTCVIQATAEVLGKMYGVLSKRHGRILHEEMKEGSSTFSIEAVLPVVESFGFAEDIRKRTSGLASPQLRFSHWEIIDLDPFWVPTTEEEYMHFGEKADSENIARKYMNNVRKRKGLHTDDKLVEFAEKQRTLKKNK